LIVHRLFGMNNVCGSCDAAGYLPNDPIFMLLHSFTAYLRAVWASCHGYDGISGGELDDHPEAYLAQCANGYPECGVIELDDIYQFGEMVNMEWSITSTMNVTPRKMWDFSDWNIRYVRGSFIHRSGLETSGECDIENMLNSKWLTPSIESAMEEMEEMEEESELEILEEIELRHSKVRLLYDLFEPKSESEIQPDTESDIGSNSINDSGSDLFEDHELNTNTIEPEDTYSVDVIQKRETVEIRQHVHALMDYVEVNIDTDHTVDGPHVLNLWKWCSHYLNYLLYVTFVIVFFTILCVLIWCIRHHIIARGGDYDFNSHHDALKSTEHREIYGSV